MKHVLENVHIVQLKCKIAEILKLLELDVLYQVFPNQSKLFELKNKYVEDAIMYKACMARYTT